MVILDNVVNRHSYVNDHIDILKPEIHKTYEIIGNNYKTIENLETVPIKKKVSKFEERKEIITEESRSMSLADVNKKINDNVKVRGNKFERAFQTLANSKYYDLI